MQPILQLSIKLFLVTAVLNSCMVGKTFSENSGTIDYASVKEISIVLNDSTQRMLKLITGKEAIKEFVDDLNTAPADGPWKGAKWDKILLVCADTTIQLNTNGKVFGKSSSGQFFKLNKRYQEFWKQ